MRWFVLLLPVCATAQTPPIKPTTPDVPVFPAFSISTLEQRLAGEPLTVEEAVAIALETRPSRDADLAAYQASRARLAAARSDLLPQLSLNYSGTQVRILRGQQFAGSQGIGFRSQGSVAVSQLLFDFGRTRALVLPKSKSNWLTATEPCERNPMPWLPANCWPRRIRTCVPL